MRADCVCMAHGPTCCGRQGVRDWLLMWAGQTSRIWPSAHCGGVQPGHPSDVSSISDACPMREVCLPPAQVQAADCRALHCRCCCTMVRIHAEGHCQTLSGWQCIMASARTWVHVSIAGHVPGERRAPKGTMQAPAPQSCLHRCLVVCRQSPPEEPCELWTGCGLYLRS